MIPNEYWRENGEDPDMPTVNHSKKRHLLLFLLKSYMYNEIEQFGFIVRQCVYQTQME